MPSARLDRVAGAFLEAALERLLSRLGGRLRDGKARSEGDDEELLEKVGGSDAGQLVQCGFPATVVGKVKRSKMGEMKESRKWAR